MIDLDPQCNLSIYAMNAEELQNIWEAENPYIEKFDETRKADMETFQSLIHSPRSIHFLLKPREEGVANWEDISPNQLPPPVSFTHNKNLFLLPSRLTLHKYETALANTQSGLFSATPSSIGTFNQIRKIYEQYSQQNGYDYVLIDVSPSLGVLNKNIISTADCFLIPCNPDIFSLYGIKNIANALKEWKQDFDTLQWLYDNKFKGNKLGNNEFAECLGYTIFNARKYSGETNKWNMSMSHYNLAISFPDVIKKSEIAKPINGEKIAEPIGGTAVMYSFNTRVSYAQVLKLPMWEVPNFKKYGKSLKDLPESEINQDGINSATAELKKSQSQFKSFADDLLARLDLITKPISQTQTI